MILDDLTVFIISTGEDTAKDCVDSLRSQDVTFEINIIENVFPMSKAFQSMPERCRTPYFIQVDADMILEPHAVRTLYEGGLKSGFFPPVVYGQLYEEGFGVGGSIRLWKKRLFDFFSFRDCRTVDRDLYNRIKWFGFKRKNLDMVLGIHRPRHSEFSIYLKAKSDIEKWRFLKRGSGLYAENLYDEIVEDIANRADQYFGLLLGALTPKERYLKSKDLSIEKKRFEIVTESFGKQGAVPLLNVEDITKQGRAYFIDCYNDFQGSNLRKKERLAGAVIQLFGDNGAVKPDIDKLLEITSL